jgi:hypothetical protein
MRPDFGDVKKTTTIVHSLFGFHDLNIELPDRVLFARDGTPQILVMEVGIHTGHASGLFFREMGDVVNGPEVEFAIAESTISSDHLESMHTKASDPTNRIRDASGPEEMHQSMNTFGLVHVEVPELRNPLLAATECILVNEDLPLSNRDG